MRRPQLAENAATYPSLLERMVIYRNCADFVSLAHKNSFSRFYQLGGLVKGNDLLIGCKVVGGGFPDSDFVGALPILRYIFTFVFSNNLLCFWFPRGANFGQVSKGPLQIYRKLNVPSLYVFKKCFISYYTDLMSK